MLAIFGSEPITAKLKNETRCHQSEEATAKVYMFTGSIHSFLFNNLVDYELFFMLLITLKKAVTSHRTPNLKK